VGTDGPAFGPGTAAECRCGETGNGAPCEPLGCTEPLAWMWDRWFRPAGGVGGVGSGIRFWRGRTYDPRVDEPTGRLGTTKGGRGRTGPFPLPPGGVPFRFTGVPPTQTQITEVAEPTHRTFKGQTLVKLIGPLPPRSGQSRPQPPHSVKLLANMATMGPGTAPAFSARGCERPAKHWCLQNRTNSTALPGYRAFWPGVEPDRWEYPQMGCRG